jgi:GNAT superfamily N-acetyltransferase
MDELQKLYDALVQRGYYTKGINEFRTQFQDPAYQEKVFGVVTRDGLFTKSKEEFFTKYNPGQPSAVPTDKKKVGTESVSEDGSLALPKREVAESTAVKRIVPQVPVTEVKQQPDEADYFTGAFGDLLKGVDKIVPIGIGELVDDISRSIAIGYRRGQAEEEADRLLLQGTKPTAEQLKKFIQAQKNVQALGSSKEEQDYIKTYKEEGEGVWGMVKGLALNPSYVPQLILRSLTEMATNADALTAAAAAVGTGATIGATTGAGAGTAVLPVIGTVGGAAAGAASGAAAALPYAFGLASSAVELGASFGESIMDELNGKPFTEENVKAILEDPEKYSRIRNKAIARGAVIGAVDTYTGKLAGKVGAQILSKSAAKSATGAVTRGAVTRAAAAGAGIEAAGGSVGEAAARVATGDELDVSEIGLEAIASLPGGVRSTIQARLAKPSYQVNGQKVAAADVDELINTMTPEELSATKIEIKNDYEGRQNKIQDKIVTGAIKEQVKQANPDVDETTIDELVSLEKELKKFEGNTTQSGKDKAAQIRSQIKTIQENAVQKQAAGEVPVQPTTGISEEVEEGKPATELEVITEEGVTPEVKKEEVKPIDFSKQLEDKYGVAVDLLGSLDSDKPLSLSRIVVPEKSRRQGIGSQVMKDIIEYADNNNKKITLTPSTDFGGESVEALTDFYKNFGFVENKGENKDFTIKDTMYRIPEVSLKTQPAETAPVQQLPDYNRMMGELQGVVDKSLERGANQEVVMQNAINYLQGSKVYETATDVERETLVRDVREMFQKREKAAPSVAKILGQTKEKVTVDEMAALKDQIRLEARAAREAKADLNTKRKRLTDLVRKMATEGKLTVNKVAALVNKIGKVNLDNPTIVNKFIDYSGKVFADAEYDSKLGTARKLRSQLRSLSKNKEKAANLRDLSKQFAEIDPSMVDDIDTYNRVSSLIRESIKGSTMRKGDVNFANMVKESEAMEYINKTMEEQKKKLFDMKVQEVQDLLGVDASELSYDQLVQMLEKEGPMTKDNEKLVRSAINKAFDLYSTLVKESITTGKDLFTGEDVEYTANQKKVIKEFMDMDLNVLKPKQALEAVDALMNFMQNQSIAKMESVVAKYKGDNNMIIAEKKGIKAKPISKYWSKGLGKLLVEQTANLNILFERMFGGFNRGGMVENLMGVTAVKNGKSKAQTESNNIVNEYVSKFYKSKPNGEAFNTASNNTERGIVAFMTRNLIGTEAEMQAEFNRRKALLDESINVLKEGNEDERAKADIYQQVYDNILKDSNNLDEVKSNAAKENVEAVQFWQEKWDNKYDELSDVALGVYNKVLGKDINYTPDVFKKLSSDPGDVELTSEDMGFLVNSGNAPLYKKETGVLMAATRPESLPQNEKTGRVNRYIDLSFDSNNANSMYDALVDINTAAPIRQVESALNSDAFARIMKESGDEKLLRNRIDLYVKNIRKKNPFSNDEFSKAVKGLNRLASIGVGQALGGVLQPIKQVVPIAMNTLINAGGLDINSITNTAKQNFINNSGYAIANRGIESQAQVNTLNKMINDAASSKPEQAFRQIEKINNWWLKNLLVRFDVAIARASWMTYYEQSLQKQGIDPKTIDYNTHEVNQEAADYAQRQVDRQQNVSDTDLAGALLSSKDAKTQLFVKILMPFASFRMNQSARLGSDLTTMLSKTATKEDKVVAARSLGGFAAEMATFRLLSAGAALLIAESVKGVLGREDDEEKDKKKNDAIVKGQLTSTVADVFSPAPLLDKAVQMGASAVLDATQDALDIDEEERLAIYSGNKQDFFQSLGLLGIAGSRANQLYEMAKLSSGGSYEDDYGRKKYLSESDQNALGTLIPIAIVSNLGLVPSEVNSIVRSSIADAKRSASTKEGGKTDEDVSQEERAKELSGERKEKTEQNKKDKVDVLEKMKTGEVDANKKRAIQDMIDDLTMTSEEKKEVSDERKKEKLDKKEEMKKLLQGYDNKTDMKRYDPRLYEETFGENSEYYRKNEAEMEVEKELNKLLREKEDEEMGYTPTKKRKKARSSSRSYRFKRYSESQTNR